MGSILSIASGIFGSGAGIWLYVAAGIAIAIASFGEGYHIASDHAAAQQLVAVEAAQHQAQADAAKANAASAALEGQRNAQAENQQTVTKFVDRVVERPVYRNVCFDADGLRAVNAAIAGAAPDSGQPDAAVPAAPAAAKR